MSIVNDHKLVKILKGKNIESTILPLFTRTDNEMKQKLRDILNNTISESSSHTPWEEEVDVIALTLTEKERKQLEALIENQPSKN